MAVVEWDTVEAVSDGVGADALENALWALERERRRIEADIAELIAEADLAGVFLDDGHRSVTAWAESICNWSPAEARSRTRLAHLRRELPSVLPALAAADIGVAQAFELARLAANPRSRPWLAGSEELLTDQATRLCFVDFRTVCRRWEALADQDGAHRDHEDARRHRHAAAVLVGTQFHLDAHGDVMAGAVMAEILDRFTDAEFHADWDDAKAQLGQAACPALLARTPQQRRFDALHNIFLTAAGAPLAPHRSEPLVNLMVDVRTFDEYVARYLGQPAPAPDPATVLTRRCETTAGVPVDGYQAVAAALAGQIRRIICDSTGRVLDVGRRRRLFTGAARDAIGLTDRRCTWPGCYVRAAHAQVDHSTDWRRGGGTDVGNGDLECGHHNRHKNRGYTTRRDAHGQWHTYRPDGSELAPRQRAP